MRLLINIYYSMVLFFMKFIFSLFSMIFRLAFHQLYECMDLYGIGIESSAKHGPYHFELGGCDANAKGVRPKEHLLFVNDTISDFKTLIYFLSLSLV